MAAGGDGSSAVPAPPPPPLAPARLTLATTVSEVFALAKVGGGIDEDESLARQWHTALGSPDSVITLGCYADTDVDEVLASFAPNTPTGEAVDKTPLT